MAYNYRPQSRQRRSVARRASPSWDRTPSIMCSRRRSRTGCASAGMCSGISFLTTLKHPVLLRRRLDLCLLTCGHGYLKTSPRGSNGCIGWRKSGVSKMLPKSLRAELREYIRDEVNATYKLGGGRPREVAVRVIAQHKGLVNDLGDRLAEDAICDMARKMMKSWSAVGSLRKNNSICLALLHTCWPTFRLQSQYRSHGERMTKTRSSRL